MRASIEIDFAKKSSDNLIESVQVGTAGNNVSTSIADASTTPEGFKGFQLAGVAGEWPSLANGQYRYFPDSGYAGYMSQVLSEADGTVGVTIIVTPATEISFLVITFDKACNEYATELTVAGFPNADDIQISNNSYVCPIKLPEATTSTFTIRITKWNKPFKSVKVTSISTGYTGIFKGSEIGSFECSEQVWDSQFKLATGVMQQYADITFRDVHGILRGLAETDALQEMLQVRIYSIDTDGTKTLLGVYISDTWSCSGVDDRVTLSCNDLTRNFENIVTDVVGKQLTVAEVLNLLNSVLPNFQIVPKEDTYVTDPTTGTQMSMTEYLSACVCEDVYFQSVALSSILSEICDRWMLRLYWQPEKQQYVVMEAW